MSWSPPLRDQSTPEELIHAQAGKLLQAASVRGEPVEPRDRFDAQARAMLEATGQLEPVRRTQQGRQSGLFGGGR